MLRHSTPLIAVMLGLLTGTAAAEPRPAGEIQSLIDDAIAGGKAEVVIPPGEYRGPAVEGAVLTIKGARDLTVVAEDVTLIATTLDRIVSVRDSEKLTIRGLTLDHDPLPFSQGTIVKIGDDGRSLDVEIDAGYDADLNFGGRRVIVYDADSRSVKHGTWTRYNIQASVLDRGKRLVRLEGRQSFKDATAVGDLVTVTKPTRTPHGLMVEDSRDCVFSDVTIYTATSFAIFERGGEGGNTYERCRVVPGPALENTPRLLASSADAFHSKHAGVGPRVIDCHFEAMGDDGIAINGDYALVLSVEGDTAIVAAKVDMTFRVGDRVHAFNAEGKRTGLARVAELEPMEWGGDKSSKEIQLELFPKLRQADRQYQDTYAVTLETPLDLEPGDLLSSPDRNGSGFVVRGNIIKNHRARGILIKASDGVVENNDIDGSSIAGILLTPEITFWMEADFSSDVVIRGNRIANVGHQPTQPNNSFAGAITITAPGADDFFPAGGHVDLTIEGNTVEHPFGPAIVATSVDGLAIKNNRFVAPASTGTSSGTGLGVNPNAVIWLANVCNVDLTGNVIVEPGKHLGQPIVVAGESESVNGVERGIEIE